MGEFDIIERYFNASQRPPRKDVLLSIGDDCALTSLKPNQQLAITTDTLVCGTHFLPTISPADLAYKSVASNLSDLAAMGAEPAWISLALTLPEINHDWLAEFSEHFFEILDHYNVDLIGGDTTCGPLSLTITAQGIVPQDRGLFRHNAKVGDWIYVSGTLGDSAGGLQLLLNQQSEQVNWNKEQSYLIQRHLRPTPRVLLGLTIASIANAAIDISDGLLSDLSHILKRSDCGAVLNLENFPLSDVLLSCYSRTEAEYFALNGGEDYELCFTVPNDNKAKLDKALANIGVTYTCIGQIRSAKEGLTLLRHNQPVTLPSQRGYDHFKK
ncbi:TPA: thiamine-phosphate kinase [Mannheimia haemolytica]|uniref:Thiamine-monophosphate kinase n=2 Tax=Mannheimia haemolytica TaxID=75985 RepID=A0A248ZZ42_MANHA|nr:thiamine-phosphate kinase [Mannheimia haemolytica]AWW70921.1 thiamine-phosphate kinase [Pasteurellaceae bacterium 12565]AGI32018.1 thiamine-phosphate kinase [Mannheimia haemolytica USDA-ARS-USMARC-183]AGI35872.1 thiamine-phosphate kinase [Mannheimia haemolytica USDA-ARS-USMARC-185]AGK03152.1 thiamine-monophosphate kinase ThiL [Mannheimia haemolytica M42548]AGQ25233.1 thiamine monophosphate kinase [Mannheimia haemolytica D153]